MGWVVWCFTKILSCLTSSFYVQWEHRKAQGSAAYYWGLHALHCNDLQVLFWLPSWRHLLLHGRHRLDHRPLLCHLWSLAEWRHIGPGEAVAWERVYQILEHLDMMCILLIFSSYYWYWYYVSITCIYVCIIIRYGFANKIPSPKGSYVGIAYSSSSKFAVNLW